MISGRKYFCCKWGYTYINVDMMSKAICYSHQICNGVHCRHGILRKCGENGDVHAWDVILWLNFFFSLPSRAGGTV